MAKKLKKLITHVVVTKNDSIRLERTLDSIVRNSNLTSTEVVIVDGNSTDNTTEVIRKFAPFVDKYEKQRGQGIYNAMNQGWALCAGDYINFINCGDLLLSQPDVNELKPGSATAFKTKGLKRGPLPLWVKNSVTHHGIYYCRTLLVNYNENLRCCADYMETIRLKKKGALRFASRATVFVERPRESGSVNPLNYIETSRCCNQIGGLYKVAGFYYLFLYLLSRAGFKW